MNKRLLGGLDAAGFLRRHWQKRPLVVRQALPDIAAIAEPDTLFRLAGNADVESRLISRQRNWSLEHGPFSRRRLQTLPARRWTLLVQGLNLHLPAADRLLRRFAFIPHARLDDVMVSYAVRDGGVGPHTDSYDVFLIQGRGQRRWRIGPVPRPEFIPGLDLRILRQFRPTAEYVMEPGDLLYLPPGWGHDGVALDECLTYSIGFRAPARQELLYEFLLRAAEQVSAPGLYADPDLAPQSSPARIPDTMIDQVDALVRSLRFSRRQITRFVGEYLSEPKARVVFVRPERRPGPGEFARRALRHGVQLDPGTIMLFRDRELFINGECRPLDPRWRASALALANRRELGPQETAACASLLHEWHCNGWLHLGGTSAP